MRNLTTAEFDQTVQSAPLAMVDFWADWCGPCKMLGPTVEALAEQYGDKVLAGKVNVDQEPELARRFGIDEHPHGGIFEKRRGGGPERLVMPPAVFAQVLDQNL